MSDDKKQESKRPTPTVSAREGGEIVELIYDPERRKMGFAVWRDGNWTIDESLARADGSTLVPYSPENNLIRHEVVVLPSAPEEYGGQAELLGEIEAYLHRYLDLEPSFERVTSHYVLLSWLYEAFNELPYLRFQGDFGTGKTRALIVIGSICQKAFFASGASTVSPIFHILDAFRGTLVFDEADFRMSDEKAEAVKILNNGNVRGMPVLRTMMNRHREFNPHAFHVFGPKVIATRGAYRDQALESRFITEEMRRRALRKDIPLNLPSSYRGEARALRNKLLLYRFRNLETAGIGEDLADSTLSARLNQMFVPLLSIVEDRETRDAIASRARGYQADRTALLGLGIEARLLEVIRDLNEGASAQKIPLGEIADSFRLRFGAEYARPVTNRWLGTRIRQSLHLPLYKSNGVYVLPLPDAERLKALFDHYGVDTRDNKRTD